MLIGDIIVHYALVVTGTQHVYHIVFIQVYQMDT